MAVHVAIVTTPGQSGSAGYMRRGDFRSDYPQITVSIPLSKQYISSTASSTATTISTDAVDDVWEVSVIGGSVWMKAGTAPTAAQGDDRYLAEGTHHFAAQFVGEKLAFLDA